MACICRLKALQEMFCLQSGAGSPFLHPSRGRSVPRWNTPFCLQAEI